VPLAAIGIIVIAVLLLGEFGMPPYLKPVITIGSTAFVAIGGIIKLWRGRRRKPLPPLGETVTA
jgi:hypothetical protein